MFPRQSPISLAPAPKVGKVEIDADDQIRLARMRHRAAEWQAHSDDDDDDDEVTVLEESSKLGNMEEVVEAL